MELEDFVNRLCERIIAYMESAEKPGKLVDYTPAESLVKTTDEGSNISPDSTKDWAGNFVHMTGLPDEDGSFHKLMQLYFMLHCDHEGGNVSAFASHTVASALSDPYYVVSAGLNGLAGPLHGLANQECLKFVLSVFDEFKGLPNENALTEYCWNRLNNGRVIPGYGHAVLSFHNVKNWSCPWRHFFNKCSR